MSTRVIGATISEIGNVTADEFTNRFYGDRLKLRIALATYITT